MKRGPAAEPERYLLAVASVIPLALVQLILTQVPGVGLAAPSALVHSDGVAAQLIKRPQPSNAEPPPTLAPPTPTPRPTATPVPTSAPTTTPEKNRTYTVEPGDELKHVAAEYHISIWQIVQTNDIPNPDTLRIGQVLKIPDD